MTRLVVLAGVLSTAFGVAIAYAVGYDRGYWEARQKGPFIRGVK